MCLLSTTVDQSFHGTRLQTEKLAGLYRKIPIEALNSY